MGIPWKLLQETSLSGLPIELLTVLVNAGSPCFRETRKGEIHDVGSTASYFK